MSLKHYISSFSFLFLKRRFSSNNWFSKVVLANLRIVLCLTFGVNSGGNRISQWEGWFGSKRVRLQWRRPKNQYKLHTRWKKNLIILWPSFRFTMNFFDHFSILKMIGPSLNFMEDADFVQRFHISAATATYLENVLRLCLQHTL